MATSAYQRGSNGRLSMLEKSLERRRVNKEHNSNFRAGHVPVHEDHLHKTGLRGRKRYFAFCFLALLYISALGNLAITVLVMWTLRIDQYGLESLQLVRGGLVRFLNEADIDNIVTKHGEIGGFSGQDLELTGQDAAVRFVAGGKSASVDVRPGETVLRGLKGLEVTSPRSGATIFHTDPKKAPILPTQMNTLQTSQITASRIISDTGDDLVVSSEGTVELLSSETLAVASKTLNVTAGEILVTSMSKMVVLDAGLGTYVNPALLPRASASVANRRQADVFKLCVCRTSGKIFRVPVGTGDQHPCANLANGFNLCV